MAEVRSHDVSLPRPRVASTEPTLGVPRLNDVGNHFTNHIATRNRENNKTPNKYPVTRKSSDLLGLHRRIGELSSIPPHGQVPTPPGASSFSIPPYRNESATQRRTTAPHQNPTLTNTISNAAPQPHSHDGPSTVHLHRVDKMNHNASPEPKGRGGGVGAEVRRPVARPSSLSERRGNSTATIQSPPGGASSAVPTQEFLGNTRSRSPVAVYSDPVPINESEPALSFDVHSTSLSPNPPHHDDAITQTPSMGVDEGTTTTDLPPTSHITRSPSNPDNLPSQQDADEYLCSSSDESTEEEEDGAYYPHTTEDLQEELRRLRAEMATEGEVLEKLKAEEVAAKNSCDELTHQPSMTNPSPKGDELVRLQDGINDSNTEEAKLRATLLEMNISTRNAQARRQHYAAERGKVGDSVYGEVSSIQLDADVAQEQMGGDGGLEAHRAVGTLIHRKNMASEALEQASHDLATASGDMPALNAASRDARTRYTQEVTAATKRAAAERAALEAVEEESEKLKRDEVARLQLRAREFVRVSATVPPKEGGKPITSSSVNSSTRESHSPSQGRSPPAKQGYTIAVKPTITKRDPTKGTVGGRTSTTNKVLSSANASRTTSLAAKSVGSTATSTTIPIDKRKPFVVPNKRPPSQPPQQRNPSPSLPPRSNTPQAISSRDGRLEGVGGYGVRSGRRPISPQAAPPQQQRLGGGIRSVMSDEPPATFRRLMTPPSVSSRVSIPQQRHLHMEAPPHPSNMAVAQRSTSLYY